MSLSTLFHIFVTIPEVPNSGQDVVKKYVFSRLNSILTGGLRSARDFDYATQFLAVASEMSMVPPMTTTPLIPASLAYSDAA